MGATAVTAMIERVRDPKLPARDILLNFHLVVRDSCGARKKKLTALL
jgi:DNA-binding LacI/PurR family transcriptional regulator